MYINLERLCSKYIQMRPSCDFVQAVLGRRGQRGGAAMGDCAVNKEDVRV